MKKTNFSLSGLINNIMNQNPPYNPINQKLYCCVPACISMILERRNISYWTQDEIWYELGLVVPGEKVHLYTKVRTGKKPISGYWTQVWKKQYSVNNFFKKNNIWLKETYFFIDDIPDIKDFIISNIQKNNDIIVCFNNEKLHWTWNRWHVSLIQWLENDNIFLVDPGNDFPKIKKVSVNNLIKSIEYHWKEKRWGFWIIND